MSVIISRTHIALASQNPRWPVPRYADPPVPPQEPPFVCLVKHKITDITSLVSDELGKDRKRKSVGGKGGIRSGEKNVFQRISGGMFIEQTKNVCTYSSHLLSVDF